MTVIAAAVRAKTMAARGVIIERSMRLQRISAVPHALRSVIAWTVAYSDFSQETNLLRI